MLDGLHRLSGIGGVLRNGAMADQLLACYGMLAFGESGEMLGVDGTREPEGLGKLALPLAKGDVPLLPVVLLRRSELLGVVGLGLAGVQRFGDREHRLLDLRVTGIGLGSRENAERHRGRSLFGWLIGGHLGRVDELLGIGRGLRLRRDGSR